MGAYQDAILAAQSNSLVVHLPLSETIPGPVTNVGNTAHSFVSAHTDVTGGHATIVFDEAASAHYNLLGNTSGTLGYTVNLRSVRLWFKAESDPEEIISFGRSDDIYQDVKVYLDGGVIKVDIDNTTLVGTTTVDVNAKIYIFIQLINSRFYLFLNGAPGDSSEITFVTDVAADYEFDWFKVSTSGTVDSLVSENTEPLQDQLGNYLVTAASINHLTDTSGGVLTDGTNQLF